MACLDVNDINTFDHLIKTQDIQGVSKTLQECLGTPHKTCRFLVHVFACHYCDTNVWVVNKFHTTLKQFETSKPKEKQELLKILLEIFTFLNFRSYTSITSGTINIDTIQQWVYGNTYDARITDRYFASMLNEEITGCLRLLEMLIMVRDIQRTMYVLKHITNIAIHTKQKSITSNKDTDLLWLIFELLFIISPEKCKDFIGMARDIFFYKLQKSQKDVKISRLPLLFNATHVCLKGKYTCKSFELSQDVECDRMDYLYIIPDIDIDLCEEVQEEKFHRHAQQTSRKTVRVSCKELERINHLKKNVNIVRKT